MLFAPTMLDLMPQRVRVEVMLCFGTTDFAILLQCHVGGSPEC